MANLFANTKILSVQLQSPRQDLSNAFSNVKIIINIFEEKRKKSDKEFSKYFKNASELAILIGEEIKKSRVCAYQTKRSNIETSNPEKWYRINTFISFIDHIVVELNTRFNNRFKQIIPLEGLIPIYIK